MKKAKYGYCAVTGDFLHIGHIKFMKEAKKHCELLIVGIMTDTCVEKYKGRKPLMSFAERREIVESLKFVHKTMVQDSFEFPHSGMSLKFMHKRDFIIFDSAQHKRSGADKLIPYSKGISSTLLKEYK